MYIYIYIYIFIYVYTYTHIIYIYVCIYGELFSMVLRTKPEIIMRILNLFVLHNTLIYLFVTPTKILLSALIE